MPKLCDSDVRERVQDDEKVQAALSDLIAAIQTHGRDRVSGIHLVDVIAMRIENWELHEVEPEGMDDDGPWEAA